MALGLRSLAWLFHFCPGLELQPADGVPAGAGERQEHAGAEPQPQQVPVSGRGGWGEDDCGPLGALGLELCTLH